MSFVTIVIDLAGSEWTRQPERDAPFGLPLRLIESKTDAARTFTLVQGTRSVYTLTTGEADEFLHLLGQMAVKAPWEGPALGCDGCTYTLILNGPMSGVTFRWWVKIPAGWESIGAVADYVLHLAERVGLPLYG
jgi:hypothetical protein